MERTQRVESLFLSTQTMIRAWKSYFAKVLEPENISLMQMGLLFHLGSLPRPATGRELGAVLHLSPSAAAQLLDGLDGLGYIIRESAPQDKRIKYFSLSPAGTEKYAALKEKRNKFFANVTATLSDEEVEAMTQLQEKMTRQITSMQSKNKGETCS
ncbi:MAG: hypothetical protein JWP13_118 [Candidatus Saccharibacteria bacterium]|nr:hypothetical protein [Candidatus Saccharibacteria bacterium]